jgi:hypothetical protein
MKTAVDFLWQQVLSGGKDKKTGDEHYQFPNGAMEQAKEMAKIEKLKHQLFIGKVSEIIGCRKTIKLLKECNNEIL